MIPHYSQRPGSVLTAQCETLLERRNGLMISIHSQGQWASFNATQSHASSFLRPGVMDFRGPASQWAQCVPCAQGGKAGWNLTELPIEGPSGAPGPWGVLIIDYDERKALSLQSSERAFAIDCFPWSQAKSAVSARSSWLRELVLSGRVRRGFLPDGLVLDLPEPPKDVRNAMAWVEREARRAYPEDRKTPLSMSELTCVVEIPGWTLIEDPTNLSLVFEHLGPNLSERELEGWKDWVSVMAPSAQVPALSTLVDHCLMNLRLSGPAASPSLPRPRM